MGNPYRKNARASASKNIKHRTAYRQLLNSNAAKLVIGFNACLFVFFGITTVLRAMGWLVIHALDMTYPSDASGFKTDITVGLVVCTITMIGLVIVVVSYEVGNELMRKTLEAVERARADEDEDEEYE